MAEVQDIAADIFKALADEPRIAFSGVVGDIDKHVLPTMAMIAQNLVTIGDQLASGEINKKMADIEVDMQLGAATSVLVGFANTTLKGVQDILNTVLGAVKEDVNRAIGFTLL